MSEQRIVVGSDHAAVALKREIIEHLKSLGRAVEDLGAFTAESTDYPDHARLVAGRVASGTATAGILLCGTGIGVSIAANKVRGVRAALCHDVTTARQARRHNDANVLCLGARTTGSATALDIVETFLSTPFDGGRHQRRIDKIHALEKEPQP